MEDGLIWLFIIGGWFLYALFKRHKREEDLKKVQKEIADIGNLETRVVEDVVISEGRELKVFNVQITL